MTHQQAVEVIKGSNLIKTTEKKTSQEYRNVIELIDMGEKRNMDDFQMAAKRTFLKVASASSIGKIELMA